MAPPNQTPAAQGTVGNPVQRTGDTLTVGCRLPNGIVLQLHDLEDQERFRPDGTSFKVKVAVAQSRRVVLNGNAKYRGGEREILHDIQHGAGLTFAVDAAFFQKWMDANKDTEVVRRGLVFAHRTNDITGQAKEHRSQASGLEPVDPKNLPAEFKGSIETHKAA